MQAVERFYARVVDGSACLGALGVASAQEVMLGGAGAVAAATASGTSNATDMLSAAVGPCISSDPAACSAPAAGGSQAPNQQRGKRDRRTYLFYCAYLGTAFDGWLYQPDANSVETALQGRLGPLAPGTLVLACSGRTDKGVSAACQVSQQAEATFLHEMCGMAYVSIAVA